MPRAAQISQDRHSATPEVRLSLRAAGRLRAGHPWVYRSDLEQSDALPRGGLVRVTDQPGRFLGSALTSSSSQIALRMISDGDLSEGDLVALLVTRVRAAIAYRKRLHIPEQSNAYRLIFSEADQLPGLIVDRYNDVLAFQVLTQAMDRSDVRDAFVTTLEKELRPAGIIERVEERIRELEDLPPIPGGLVRGAKSQTIIDINTGADKSPLHFHYDAAGGQKTGAFLDQRENYAAAAKYARGSAMDVFCYQGGFAMHLAQACSQVAGVDSSRGALEAAERNFELNRESLAAREIE